MIQECLDTQAPVKTIQISNRAQEKLSITAKEALAARDTADQNCKQSGLQNDLRELKIGGILPIES